MDARNYSLIDASVRKQMDQIERVRHTLVERAAQIESGGPAIVEGAAFHVHNYYSAVEDLLKIVATAFENNIADVSHWHSELIDRMTLDIEGIRPRLLSADTAALLHRLRSFRHFFRHAYRVELEESEIQSNVKRVQQVDPLLRADVERFLAALSALD